MKFTTQASDLAKAFSQASTVKPVPVDSTGAAGYLCVVRGDTCFIYSEDDRQKIRTQVAITESDGEGAFVFPSSDISGLKFLTGPVEIESRIDDGAFVVEYSMGLTTCPMNSFDPRALQSLDKDFASATEQASIPTSLLKEAISSVKGYVAESGEANQTPKPAQLMFTLFSEGKGDGNMQGSAAAKAAYFYSEGLKGKPLAFHRLRLPLIQSFLAQSSGDVKVFTSENSTYIQNGNEQVIGWSDQVVEAKYALYPLEVDKFILRIPKPTLERALNWMRAALPADQHKIRLGYSHEDTLLSIRAGQGRKYAPFSVVPLDSADSTDDVEVVGGELSKRESIEVNVNVDWMIDLVTQTKNNHEFVDLRLAPFPKGSAAFLRVVDDYCITDLGKVVPAATEGEGVIHPCRVVRYITSKK